MNKFGKTMKDTFMEMSSSLAGWIDDASTHLSKGFKSKSGTQSKKSSPKTQTPKKDIPKPEQC